MSDYETSEQVDEIAKALVAAQLSMKAALKDAKNPHLKNKYADLAAVREAVLPAFLAQGIAVTQGAAIGQAGYVAVVTQFTHISGQWMRSRVEVPYQEQKGTNIAQAYGSALSYARRYALSSMACVIAEDDDGNGAAPGVAPGVAGASAAPAQVAAPSAVPVGRDIALSIISDIRAAATMAELKAIAARVGKNPPPEVLEAYNVRKGEL